MKLWNENLKWILESSHWQWTTWGHWAVITEKLRETPVAEDIKIIPE